MSEEHTVTTQQAFIERPCPCVKNHNPIPLRVELHHVYPQSEQKKRYGRVVLHDTVPLCDTAHKNVHYAITKKLDGYEFRLSNRYQESVAKQGVEYIRAGVETG